MRRKSLGVGGAEIIAVIAILFIAAVVFYCVCFPYFALAYISNGNVLDAAGRPLPGAVLHFRDKAGTVVVVVTADRNGRFCRHGLGALCRDAIDGYTVAHFMHCTGGTDQYYFSPIGSQDVQVRDAHGKPATGLRMTFQPDQRTWETESTPAAIDRVVDNAGRVQISGIPLSARFDIASRDPRYVVRDVQVQANRQAVHYAVTVVPSATITGRLVAADGTPLGGCYAFAASAPDADRSTRSYAMGVTGSNGRFRITGLQPGAYYVSAKPPLDFHAIAPAQPVTVGGGQAVEVKLQARGTQTKKPLRH